METKEISEILLKNNVITKDVLDKALEYQSKFGSGIIQYLIAYDHIDEEALAECISEHFNFPYFSLNNCDIPNELIELVPVSIAEKYWLIPLDRVKNVLTVVMANPLDTRAIEEIERITGCKTQQTVGILSDIIKAIKRHYSTIIEDENLKKGTLTPLFINTETYEGLERRRSIRSEIKMDIHFIVEEACKKSKIKNMSAHGFLFESETPLLLDSYVTLRIDLPEEFSFSPVVCVVQVARVNPLKNKKFDIGTKLIKIPKEDTKAIIKYASLYKG